MRWRVTAPLVAIWAVLAFAVVSVLQSAPASACSIDASNCVTVGTGSPGSPGGGSSTPPGGGDGGSTSDPCATNPTGAACAGENKARMCSAAAADWAGGSRVGGPVGTLTNLSPAQLAQLNAALAANGCPPWQLGGTTIDPATLALQAAASFRLPSPSGDRSPSPAQIYNGYPFTYVHLWTYLWTSPASWRSFKARATAGANWAEVTAKPVSLTFDPGDGAPAVSCVGAGRPWVEADGTSAPSQGACGYQYSKVTGPGYDHPVTSTQTITWQLTWVGSGNTAGTLTQKTTAASGQLNVLQIKTVNR